MKRKTSLHAEEELPAATSIPNKARKNARLRTTYSSFGQDGITATANAYGHLLQITQYFGNKPSGFVAVNLDDTEEPHFVKWRAHDLQQQSIDPTQGMRLLLQRPADDTSAIDIWDTNPKTMSVPANVSPSPLVIAPPRAKASSKTSRYDVPVPRPQWVNQSESGSGSNGSQIFATEIPTIIIDTNLLLRDLDFMAGEEMKEFGLEPHYSSRITNDGYSVARMHSDYLYHRHSDGRNANKDGRNTIALFISPFINEQPQQPQQFLEPAPEDLDNYFVTPNEQAWNDLIENKTLEITLAYTLRLITSKEEDIATSPVSAADLRKAKEQINKPEIWSTYYLSVASPSGRFQRRFMQLLLLVVISLVTEFLGKQVLCQGHLEWLFGEDHGFSPHRWATGRAIAEWESNPTLSEKSVVDASLNIIKAADFYRISKATPDTIDDFRGDVNDWIEDLHRNNQDIEYVFPHSSEDLPLQFQLSDHAIIWRALKSLELIGLSSELKANTIPGRRKSSYSSRKIQDSIFKKFTTDCTQLSERLMATSRSLSETSFLLHIEDTATLSAMKMGLFDLPKREELVRRMTIESNDEPDNVAPGMPVGASTSRSDNDLTDPWRNKHEAWMATIDSQKLHEDNDDDNWDHPLQYALAMVLSARGIHMNSQTPAQMYTFARSILLQSSSPNGLFPGLLDENKDPALFEDDDAYWHASFEVPFILWETKKFSPRTEENSTDETSSSFLLRRNSAEASISGAGFVKRYEPFTETSDLGPNYEWLYKEPEFFGFRIDLSSKAIEKFCEDHRRNVEKGSETINRAVDAVQSPKQDTTLQDYGYIIDISGPEYTKILGQRNLPFRIFSPDKIRSFIGGVRDTTNAKKRFFHFYRANLDVALNCYLASSEEEEISSFFDKHSSYSKYFFEDTTAIFNKWVVPDDATFQAIPWTETFKFPDSAGSESDKRVGRAVMSFRFDGDVFDHYWTCHFFDHNPQWLSNTQAGRPLISSRHVSGTLEADPWQQRRVLELLLFDIILKEMIKGTKGILEEIMTSVLTSSHSHKHRATDQPTVDFSEIDASTLLNALEVLSKVDSNTFASKNELWNKFQRILQVIEDDLKESLTMIALWTDREEKRNIIKAGWTPRKEQKYQGAISRLKLLNSHKIHELRRCGANVASFNMLLTRRLEVMRNDLDTKIVFLPVSFATGVFSMSGAPTRELLGSMASTACVALLITVVALLNAKVLGAELFGPIFNGIRPLSEAALRPIFRFCTGLIYLVLLSIISILPNKWIYFLQKRIEKAASEQSSLQTSANEGFIDRKVKQIRNKVKAIEKEIGEEERERRRKQKEEKRRRKEEEEEERKREEEEEEEERKREGKKRESKEKEEGMSMKGLQETFSSGYDIGLGVEDQESTLLSDGENQQISSCSTYASFGDKGVTATTNSHGHLLQITRYFDHGPSGFFCVDLTDIPPSHAFTHRMQKLQDYCTDPNSGVGVRIKHFMDFDAHTERPNEEVPKLDFIHDRWPHFVARTPKFDLETQYLVSEKTVYQIYTLKPCQGGDHLADTPRSAMNIELFVRNLSIKADSDENGSNSNHNEPQNTHYEKYSNHLSPKNDYVKRIRKIRNTVDGNQDVIALFITSFINKHPQKFYVELKSGDVRIVLEDRVLDSVLKELKEGNKLEVTLAYRLELISSGQTEFNHSVSSESLSSAQTALREPFKIPVFTQDERFNSNLRRNLEHILSVCSIPVSSDANGKSPFIVLTCGDFSGHRISTAASFYAFRFLLLTLEDINSQSRGVYRWESDPRDNNYVAEMTFRILEVCQGHLRWLIRENAKSDATIVGDDSNPNLIQQSLISTSFQIIKAAEFCRAAMSYKKTTLTKLEIENGFRTIVGKWTAALDEKNKGRHFVFPNLREEREQWVFHLSDQAIIWWAAKSAEELALKGELQVNETSGTYPSRNGVLYSSDNIRASLLKRFTIGNSTFEKNMIAVSRSSNETRFQLQAKDTVLFYAMDLGLFDQDGSAESTYSLWQNKTEAWRCVVDYQKECEHDQTTHWDWEQPLRCALAKKREMHYFEGLQLMDSSPAISMRIKVYGGPIAERAPEIEHHCDYSVAPRVQRLAVNTVHRINII
ncbi:hypothetical protein J3E69DRAFT_355841 [Trichoderma sp. SZMC 28015]